jgi:hypothetical protein
MATINSISSTNNVNEVLERTGLRILRYTDRKVSSTFGRGALLSRLGDGVLKNEATLTNPFTLSTS